MRLILVTGLAWLLPAGFAAAQDYQAVERRLGASVAAGELTLAQAQAMMEALRHISQNRPQQPSSTQAARESLQAAMRQLHEVGEHLKSQIEEGSLTDVQAWERFEIHLREEFAPRLRQAVEAGAISQDDAHRIMREIEKATAPYRLKAAVSRGEMTEEEARAALARLNNPESPGPDIFGQYQQLGIGPDRLHEVRTALLEHEIREEQILPTLAGMLRVIHQMRSSDRVYEPTPEVRQHFLESVGLTQHQFELVLQMTRRLASTQ